MKTGMNAPEGMGIVVETADIQNYKREKVGYVCILFDSILLCIESNRRHKERKDKE